MAAAAILGPAADNVPSTRIDVGIRFKNVFEPAFVMLGTERHVRGEATALGLHRLGQGWHRQDSRELVSPAHAPGARQVTLATSAALSRWESLPPQAPPCRRVDMQATRVGHSRKMHLRYPQVRLFYEHARQSSGRTRAMQVHALIPR